MKYQSSEYHKKCIITYHKNIEGIKQSDKTPLENYISKACLVANSDVAYTIGSLLIMVYYDANKLVLPEYYFPAREVVNMMASQFKYNSDDNIITNTDLQYIKPHTHKELLSIIIDTYMKYYKKNQKCYCNISSVRR